MCRDAARREFDMVMGWSVDRLERSLQDLVGFLSELHALGIDLFLHQQGLDTTTPAGKAMFQMLGVFAEFERSIIQERVRACCCGLDPLVLGNAGADGTNCDCAILGPLFVLPAYLDVAVPDCPRARIFTPGFTSPSQYQKACISAMQHASWLFIDRNWMAPNFLKLRLYYPAIQDADLPETNRFERALQSAFEFVARDGAFELRRRVKTVDETVCASIAE
jgi:hypothetical protein